MQAIYQRLRDNYNYQGSYSSVRRFVHRIRLKEPEAVCRIETSSGEEAQVDIRYAGLQWDSKTSQRRKTWLFAYSNEIGH